jgi:protein-tyrosine phosphatase
VRSDRAPSAPELPVRWLVGPGTLAGRTSGPSTYDAFFMPSSRSGPGSHWAHHRSTHGGVDEVPLPPGIPGRLWLCGKQFIGPDPEAALAYVDGSAVVCLNEEQELARYPEYLRWLRGQPDERVLWWPIPDLYVPEADDALELFRQLRSRLDEGQRVLLHCGAGIGRAGTIAAGLLVTMGATPEDAIAHVRAHRPMGGPEAGPQTELLHWLAGQPTPGRDTDGAAPATDRPSTPSSP